MKKEAAPPECCVDPVCLMKVDPGQRDLSFTYQLRTYYFCAEACRKSFASNPEKYLAQNPPQRKSWWGRYLDRLSKATDGKPIKCH